MCLACIGIAIVTRYSCDCAARARRLARPSAIIAVAGPCSHHVVQNAERLSSLRWPRDALATAVAGGLSFVREPMFGCGLYRSTGMTQVLHIRQVIGRIHWWLRVRAEWCHRRDTQEGFETCWKDFKAAY
eukprot:COSAG01_NODE_8470_length_2774_cov_1.635888_2_plen_130_part_00